MSTVLSANHSSHPPKIPKGVMTPGFAFCNSDFLERMRNDGRIKLELVRKRVNIIR
jgi:hypothetical protein